MKPKGMPEILLVGMGPTIRIDGRVGTAEVITLESPSSTPTSMKAISLDEFKAEPGKFRAVIMIGSEPYRIGEDATSASEAVALCMSAQRSPHDQFQVFDDKGLSCLNAGSLIPEIVVKK